jgi:apolipoprotein N-acyltransferase
MKKMTQPNKLSFLWFVAGFGIFMFSRVSIFIPFIGAAIVIAPIFILRFIRTQSTKRGIFFTLLGFGLSLNIAMWGLFELGDQITTIILNLVRNSILAILFSVPYIADRLIYPKLKKYKILSTFSFPVAVTAMLFLISLEGPFDGDMVSAVYGYGNVVFKQIASIAGLWGFVFIFSWFASVINYAWEKGFKWGQIKTVTATFCFVLTAIILFGVAKTSSLINPEIGTVKIAAIFLLPEGEKEIDLEALFSKKPSPYEETMSKIEALIEKAASNGAEIIVFQENALKISEKNEPTLIEECKSIADKFDVYFSLGYGVFPNKGKGWNKNILISNQGELKVDYRKRYLLGLGDLFGETLIYKKGPEVIQSADTPYGKIGVSICRDLSFPAYARQAGEQNVDIMLNPSYDVPKSHKPLYALRAIENGFSLVRPVYNGFSYAVDPNGKLLAEMDSDNTDDGIMYTNVPTRGVNTIYTSLGDLIGWLCVLSLAVLVVMTIKGKAYQENHPILF